MVVPHLLCLLQHELPAHTMPLDEPQLAAIAVAAHANKKDMVSNLTMLGERKEGRKEGVVCETVTEAEADETDSTDCN